MTFEIEGTEQLARTLRSLGDVVKDTFWDAVETDLFQNVERRAAKHNVTGVMNRNLYSDSGKGWAEVGIKNEGMLVNWNGARVNYAAFVLYGSKPHTIYPKNKKALRFVGGSGRFVFAKKVNHPGYKGDNFLAVSGSDTFQDLQKILDRQLKISGVY